MCLPRFDLLLALQYNTGSRLSYYWSAVGRQLDAFVSRVTSAIYHCLTLLVCLSLNISLSSYQLDLKATVFSPLRLTVKSIIDNTGLIVGELLALPAPNVFVSAAVNPIRTTYNCVKDYPKPCLLLASFFEV